MSSAFQWFYGRGISITETLNEGEGTEGCSVLSVSSAFQWFYGRGISITETLNESEGTEGRVEDESAIRQGRVSAF
jgi:hypothetical protein